MTVQIVTTAKLLFHQAWIPQRGYSQRLAVLPSVDTIHAPSDKGSQVRGEKDDHVRHFFRRPQPCAGYVRRVTHDEIADTIG